MPGRLLGTLVVTAVIVAAELPVTHVSLGPLKLVLGETTFAEVSKRFGAAPIVHTGDAGESRYQACYRGAGARAPTYYVESDEMGAGERITQFQAIAVAAISVAEDSLLARDCKALPAGITVRTDRGVALGLARREVERRLGGPGRDSAGVVIYTADEVRQAKNYRATAWSFLRLRYVNERLVAFAAAAGITD